MNVYFFILIHFILITYRCNGLEQTRLNPDAANVNFLLNESGRNPSAVGPGSVTNSEYPSLGQSSATAPNSGKVRGLVSFYNSQGTHTDTPTKPLSYSSVVNGVKPQSVTTKPIPNGSVHGAQGSSFSPVTQPPRFPIAQTGIKPATPIQTNHGGSKTVTPTPPSKPHALPANNPSGIVDPSQVTHSSNPTTKPSFSSIASGGKPKPISTISNPTRPSVLPSSIVGTSGQVNTPVNRNAPTDVELQTLSEELLRKDTNNAARLITINYQQKTTSQSKDDKAPLPLVTVPQSVYGIPTIQKFIPLLDNYERDTLVNEYVTPLERTEENDFMDVIMSTQVIRQLMNFLKDKGYVTPDPRQQRDFLKQLWFGLYSRGRGKISSSGFEHVFVSELKNGEVSGLHNWLYFSKEESANRANYLGYLKYEQFGDKGAVLKLHFNQQGVDKPVDSMFIGTSPELEMALYSLCFVTRADQNCPLKLGGKSVNIVTHTFRYRSKNMIGSAYPQI